MPTTPKSEIERWFAEGKKKKATHLVVVCDTFDYEDYPVYVCEHDDVHKVVKHYDGPNMQRVMAVYHLGSDMETQLGQGMVRNFSPLETEAKQVVEAQGEVLGALYPGEWKSYVCGFAFGPSLANVVLMKKRRPTWQAGKLNGVGGGIEPGDCSESLAMQREALEETGADMPASRWIEFLRMRVPRTQSLIHFFAFMGNEALRVRTTTDEEVWLVDVKSIEPGKLVWGWPKPETDGAGLRVAGEVLYNIPWLVSMARTAISGDRHRYIMIELQDGNG